MKYNKLIAEFMGGVLTTNHPDCKHISFMRKKDAIPPNKGKYSTISGLKYHYSWKWLMPVVEKIESMGYSVKIIEDWCEIIGEDYDKVADFGGGKLISVYAAIVEFIKWYNKNRL